MNKRVLLISTFFLFACSTQKPQDVEEETFFQQVQSYQNLSYEQRKNVIDTLVAAYRDPLTKDRAATLILEVPYKHLEAIVSLKIDQSFKCQRNGIISCPEEELLAFIVAKHPQAILIQVKQLIESEQLEEALELVKSIPSQSNFYKEASAIQKELENIIIAQENRISRDLITSARDLVNNNRCMDAIPIAEGIPERSYYYNDAVNLIDSCKSKILNQTQESFKSEWETAYKAASKGEYLDAAKLARKIRPESPYYTKAKEKYKEWSEISRLSGLLSKSQVQWFKSRIGSIPLVVPTFFPDIITDYHVKVDWDSHEDITSPPSYKITYTNPNESFFLTGSKYQRVKVDTCYFEEKIGIPGFHYSYLCVTKDKWDYCKTHECGYQGEIFLGGTGRSDNSFAKFEYNFSGINSGEDQYSKNIKFMKSFKILR